MELTPIGTIHSPFPQVEGIPIQPAMAAGARGTVELDPRWEDALESLSGFERIWLLYHLHRAGPVRTRVMPFLDEVERGLFATRAPCRPNPLGLSCVRLERIEGCVLYIAEVDILDGTPLLDLKPYVPRFDAYPRARAGWVDESPVDRREADGRFREER